ncbi:monovalent cation:H+ antiporter, CPA1 family [Sporobacter termitidis DSM 10068]|uniref:Monovalent cation:H+ antiporter, CPA1 family n=1 Tax=Sporobacter termitidis DSM 10068 TaxID=1123282 RepID=A0A1M5XTH0_9FIRM|nr:Na+/H+ antiporter [Sporobacter termitidis]SHI03076.1 monovalent cation:H+ antiporter, CPA1 family [Sporobacter termitidis DSM 10068]
METLLLVLVLLILIGISNIVNHFLPFIPVPLIQIALGILAAVLYPHLHIVLDPKLFFLLFIAPLLFNDGKRISKKSLWRLRGPVLLLAMGLVFATVLCLGYAINWMIPSIPLPAAFALAAILSPTDAVAVCSIAGRVHLPKTVLNLLEGEALLNDASGLVAFKFAIAAAVTGTFSLGEASVSFLVIALGGLALGAVLAFAVIWFQLFLRRLGMEDVTMHMLLQLLTPFAIYFIAEHFEVSGILAVVAAGIVQAIERRHVESAFSTRMRIVSDSTWSVVIYILNGLVFVLLGFEIPDVIKVIWKDAQFNNAQVITYIVLITLALIVLRFAWIFLLSKGQRLFKHKKVFDPSLRSCAQISLAGVRGAVTLAGALSIPLVLQNGSPFPERDLIIFLAAGVIFLTLLIASFVLPFIGEKKAAEISADHTAAEQELKAKLIKAIIHTVKDEQTDENREATMSVLSDYRRLLMTTTDFSNNHNAGKNAYRAESEARLLGLRAEKEKLQSLMDQGEIPADIAARACEMLDHTEALLTNRLKLRIIFSVMAFFSKLSPAARRHFFKKRGKPKFTANHNQLQTMKNIKIQTSQAAIAALSGGVSEENKDSYYAVIVHYTELIDRLKLYDRSTRAIAHMEKEKRMVQYKAVQTGRDIIQSFYESGQVSRQDAVKLRHFMNQIEADTLEEENVAGEFH